ncbi:MAG: EAL domain-containing protein [Proteobacteria bacterium]|nr:EAL domain-containing protein [Pseudomonadota bacterium]
MQQIETAFRISPPPVSAETALRGAFVYASNILRVREAYGQRIAREFSARIAERLGAITSDPERQVIAIGDDCLVLWLPQEEGTQEDVLEQLMVLGGTEPICVEGHELLPALHAGWTELQTATPRCLTADECSYVLYASASYSALHVGMWRGHADRFQADMKVAAAVARVHASGNVDCAWQGVVSPYSPLSILYWRGVPRLAGQAADARINSHDGFMPSLERLALTRLVDRAQVMRIFARLLDDPSLRLACRISSMSVRHDSYWSHLFALLEANPGAASRFTLEISGRTALPSLEDARTFCDAIRQRGGRIAMAGFGSGPVNLEGLQACSPQTLLLDDSFVLRSRHHQDAARALRDMIRICAHLAEQIVVAGVESEHDYANALRAGARWMCGGFVNGASFDPAQAAARRAEDAWNPSDSPAPARGAPARPSARAEAAFHGVAAVVPWGFAG